MRTSSGAVAGLMAFAILVGCACGSVSHSKPRPQYRIATYGKADAYPKAGISGVLFGQANEDGTACFWGGGPPPEEAFVWPPGYTAGGDPLSVFDAQGRPVAVVGRDFVGGGGVVSLSPVRVLGCAGLRYVWAMNPMPPIK
jgi:hypothetical protein